MEQQVHLITGSKIANSFCYLSTLNDTLITPYSTIQNELLLRTELTPSFFIVK